MTSLISGNHKPSCNMFFKTAVCQMLLKFVFHREYFNKVIHFICSLQMIVNFTPYTFNLSHISSVKTYFSSSFR